MNNEVYIIGVAGGSGSGKTFFAQTLAKKLGPEVASVLYQDNYYIDQSHRFDHDGGSVNFDHPESLDFSLLAEHLKVLKSDRSVEIPLYNFATHKRLDETQTFKAKRVVIVDGILILSQPKLIDIFDDSIFVETPESIRFQRRLTRDIEERGRTEDGVKAQFEAQVKPMHDEFVEPSKHNATYVSSGTDMHKFNMLLDHIRKVVFSPETKDTHLKKSKSYQQFYI